MKNFEIFVFDTDVLPAVHPKFLIRSTNSKRFGHGQIHLQGSPLTASVPSEGKPFTSAFFAQLED